MANVSRRLHSTAVVAVALGLLTPALVYLSPTQAAPPWSTTQTISTGTEPAYDAPAMAISRDGTRQIAFWQSTDGGITSVKSASANLSGGVAIWGPTTTVASITTGASARPDIALSWDGSRATAVWHDSPSSGDVIKSASVSIVGTTQTWGDRNLVQAPAGIAEVPKVALAAGGDLAVVTWYKLTGYRYNIMARAAAVSGNAQTWDSGSQIISDPAAPYETFHAQRPEIAMDDDGSNVTVVFYVASEDFQSGGVQSNSATIAPGPTITSGPTVTWGSPSNLITPGAGVTASDVAVAVSNDGSEAIASWTRGGAAPEYTSYVQTSVASISGSAATWRVPAIVSDSGESAGESQVTLSNDGTRALATWSQATSTGAQVIQAKSATISGTTPNWTSAATISDSNGFASAPSLSAATDGALATVVWSQATTLGEVNVVQSSNSYLSGSSMVWSDPNNLSSTSATPLPDPDRPYGGLRPQVGVSSDGLIAASIWQWFSGSAYSLQGTKANGTCTQFWDGSTQCLPGAPTSIVASAGNASASLTWTAPTDPYGYGVTNYAVEVVNAGTSAVVRDWTSTGSASPSVTLTGLANGTSYFANIRTINSFGWSAAATASSSFTPVAPSGGPSAEVPPATPTSAPATTAATASQSSSTVSTVAQAGIPDNPPTAVVLATGMVLVSAQVADRTQPRVIKREPTSTLKQAPVISARAYAPISLVTSGFAPGIIYQVKIKVDGSYAELGMTLTDAAGIAQLPVFRSATTGRFTIALINSATQATTYLKVSVTK